MHRLTRLVAAFLVATLVIHMGDWPFVDELLEDLQAQGVFWSEASEQAAETLTLDEGIEIPTGAGFQYSLAFAGLAPPAVAGPAPIPEVAVPRYSIWQDRATDFIVAAPFKPPAA